MLQQDITGRCIWEMHLKNNVTDVTLIYFLTTKVAQSCRVALVLTVFFGCLNAAYFSSESEVRVRQRIDSFLFVFAL